ncbi:MAG: acyltransferase family protein [Candidatus Berkelbacteria bacterium]|nr:acyltransferase family protein [Candidatus Berkelbacteria bacterium]
MNSKRRFFILDLLRGIAVLLMVLAHSVYFFHDRDNSFILSLESLGNLFCFVMFLFVSGATMSVAYLRDGIDRYDAAKRIMRRIILLLISYYILAFFVVARDLVTSDFVSRNQLIINILSFRILPSFTEYIPPLIFFSLIVMLFQKQIAKIGKSLMLTIISCLVIYLIGYLLNFVPVFSFLLPWKAFFVGGVGLYRFPIFHYAPVFFVGLYVGMKLLSTEGLTRKFQFFRLATIVSLLFLSAFSLLLWKFGLISEFFLRWPPMPTFLLTGITATLALCYLFYAFKSYTRMPLLRDLFLTFGQNAYAIFWTHIFLLSFYQMAGGIKFSSPLIVLILFIATVLLSLALATFLPFNFKLSLTLIRDSHEEQERILESLPVVKLGEEVATSGRKEWWRLRRFFFLGTNDKPRLKRLVKKRHILLIAILVSAVVLLISPTIVSEVQTSLRQNMKITWWNSDYIYRQNIRVTNKDSFTGLVKDNKINIVIDHTSLISKYKVDSFGRDIAIVFFDGKNSKQIDYTLLNGWNRNDTTLTVALPETIKPNNENINLYIYFGDFKTSAPLVATKKDESSKIKYQVELKDIENYPVRATVGKRWNIFDEYNNIAALTFSANTDLDLKNPVVNWQILNTTKSGFMTFVDTGTYETSIPLSGFKPGTYQIVADIVDGDKTYQSQNCGFAVSEPLYVSWTIDWEGYDAKDDYLKAMTDIADQNDMPLTHYWNPRIYTTDTISKGRVSQLTDWIKARLDKGDDIGMHLHLFYDLVTSAGVTPHQTPNWGDNGDGYGVPLSSYTPDEITLIVNKSRQIFSDNGLPNPIYFRAGAWFADATVLNTLANLNFSSDSSGRTKYTFGKNNLPGPWNLLATTMPYYPSASDQNKSGTDNLSILEIPDNGADSYWFSAKELIERFDQNNTSATLDSKKQITFLSHPHWFNSAEQQRVTDLFNCMKPFRSDLDTGPVVFTSVSKIATAWEK